MGASAVAVVSVSAGMMSMALFTDDAIVDNNAFTTGTIDLSTSPASALFNVATMMPADATYGQLVVSNDGSAQLRYAMTTSATDPDGKALEDVVTIEIREKAAGTCSADFTGTVVLGSTALSAASFGDATAGQDSGDRVLSTGATENLCFMASLPLATGDAYQDGPPSSLSQISDSTSPGQVGPSRAEPQRRHGCLEDSDAVVAMVRHKGVDWNSVYTHARLVVDTVNGSASQPVKPGQVLRLGAGWS